MITFAFLHLKRRKLSVKFANFTLFTFSNLVKIEEHIQEDFIDYNRVSPYLTRMTRCQRPSLTVV